MKFKPTVSYNHVWGPPSPEASSMACFWVYHLRTIMIEGKFSPVLLLPSFPACRRLGSHIKSTRGTNSFTRFPPPDIPSRHGRSCFWARSARNERACEFDGEQNGFRQALVPKVMVGVNKAKKLSSRHLNCGYCGLTITLIESRRCCPRYYRRSQKPGTSCSQARLYRT